MFRLGTIPAGPPEDWYNRSNNEPTDAHFSASPTAWISGGDERDSDDAQTVSVQSIGTAEIARSTGHSDRIDLIRWIIARGADHH
jgi:hypothetical protein